MSPVCTKLSKMTYIQSKMIIFLTFYAGSWKLEETTACFITNWSYFQNTIVCLLI